MGTTHSTRYSLSFSNSGTHSAAANATRSAYLARHYEALTDPRGDERALVHLRAGLLHYAVQHSDNFEGCQIGGDSFLGAAWLRLAKAYLELLNGPTGRLDCGTLDSEVRRWAQQYGFSAEEAEAL